MQHTSAIENIADIIWWQKWDEPGVTMKAEVKCKGIIVVFQINWNCGDMIWNIFYWNFGSRVSVLVP